MRGRVRVYARAREIWTCGYGYIITSVLVLVVVMVMGYLSTPCGYHARAHAREMSHSQLSVR